MLDHDAVTTTKRRDAATAIWQVDTEPVLAAVLCGDVVVVVEALNVAQLRDFDMLRLCGDSWIRVATKVSARVRTIGVHSGEAKTLFEFECDPNLLHAAFCAGQLVLTSDAALVVCDLRDGKCVTVPHAGLEPLAAPLEHDDCLFCLWRDGDQYRVTRWANGAIVRGPAFDDRRFRYIRDWALGRDGPIVRLSVTMIGSAENIGPVLQFVDATTLELTEHAVLEGGRVLCTKKYLFLDEERESQGEPSLRPRNRLQDHEEGLAVVRCVMRHAGCVLSCRDARTGEPVKQWITGSHVTSMIDLPGFAGVLLILSDPEAGGIIPDHSYGVLTPASPGIRLLTESDGALLGAPVLTSDGVLGVVHEGGNRELYTSWLRRGCPPAGRQVRVGWHDPAADKVRADTDPAHHYYRLQELDFARSEVRIMQFWAPSPVRSVLGADDRVVLVLGRAVRAYTLADIRASSRAVPMDATGATALVASTGEDLFGSPLTGPRDELWGIDSRMPALEAFAAFLPAPRRALAAGDDDARLELLDQELQRVERDLLQRGDDVGHLAAALPAEFLGAPSTRASERFIAWERAMLVNRRGAGDEVVHASARMIFQDYIRQRTLLLHNKTVELLADVQRNRRGPFARALSWCSFAELGTPHADFERSVARSAKLRSVALSALIVGLLLVLGGVVGKLRPGILSIGLAGVAFAGIAWAVDWLGLVVHVVRSQRRQKPSHDRFTFIRMSEQWPNGPPACVVEPDRYLAFVDALRDTTLLSPGARSSRQRAVLLAGERLRQAVTVFISHSSRQATVAIELAEALRRRGMDVMLDRWHLEPDAPDPVVESWIAEGMMCADAVIYLVSGPAAASGWVMREQAWEFRLLAVKRSRALPYLVYLEHEVATTRYPRARCFGHAEVTALGVAGLADTLTRKVVADRIDVLREARSRS